MYIFLYILVVLFIASIPYQFRIYRHIYDFLKLMRKCKKLAFNKGYYTIIHIDENYIEFIFKKDNLTFNKIVGRDEFKVNNFHDFSVLAYKKISNEIDNLP